VSAIWPASSFYPKNFRPALALAVGSLFASESCSGRRLAVVSDAPRRNPRRRVDECDRRRSEPRAGVVPALGQLGVERRVRFATVETAKRPSTGKILFEWFSARQTPRGVLVGRVAWRFGEGRHLLCIDAGVVGCTGRSVSPGRPRFSLPVTGRAPQPRVSATGLSNHPGPLPRTGKAGRSWHFQARPTNRKVRNERSLPATKRPAVALHRYLRLPDSVLPMRAWRSIRSLGAWAAHSRGRIGLAYSSGCSSSSPKSPSRSQAEVLAAVRLQHQTPGWDRDGSRRARTPPETPRPQQRSS
jgi:hypothetical protein